METLTVGRFFSPDFISVKLCLSWVSPPKTAAKIVLFFETSKFSDYFFLFLLIFLLFFNFFKPLHCKIT